jgi:hypothetical protein
VWCFHSLKRIVCNISWIVPSIPVSQLINVFRKTAFPAQLALVAQSVSGASITVRVRIRKEKMHSRKVDDCFGACPLHVWLWLSNYNGSYRILHNLFTLKYKPQQTYRRFALSDCTRHSPPLAFTPQHPGCCFGNLSDPTSQLFIKKRYQSIKNIKRSITKIGQMIFRKRSKIQSLL